MDISNQCRPGWGYQGWQGRWGALVPAPRAPGQNQRPAPRAPERSRSRRLVTQATYFPQSPGHQPDLFCSGQNRGLGWHARESRSGAARRALAVSRASLRAYARRASANTHAAPARDATRDDIRLDISG